MFSTRMTMGSSVRRSNFRDRLYFIYRILYDVFPMAFFSYCSP